MGTRYKEVIVKLVPARGERTQESIKRRRSSGVSMRLYDALIYVQPPFMSFTDKGMTDPNQPEAIADLPLIAVEHVQMRWDKYEDYLAAFVLGSKDPTQMREKLFEVMSPGLEALFEYRPPEGELLRIWWKCEALELLDLPWELVTFAGRGTEDARFSFLRGLPPVIPPPLVPVGESLRLGLIHDPARPPHQLMAALDNLPGLEVRYMTGNPRSELIKAVREGFELIHIVADGYISQARDGILYFKNDDKPEMPAAELTSYLRGSRVTVLGFTAPESEDPDTITIRGREVPSAYRAFVYIGGDLSLTSTVAPLGPIFDHESERFWRGFYGKLALTLDIEKAMASGESGGPPLPMALFLRYRQGRMFQRRGQQRSRIKENPAQSKAELQASRSLVEQLDALSRQYGSLPPSVGKFISGEKAHQKVLVDEMNSLVLEEADDQ